jgi:hypothetical protein
MGISQQIGASSLIKPGVIDNTAARPASPYEGQVIFQKDTDEILAYDGTSWTRPKNMPWGIVAYDQITSPVTGITSETVVVTGSSFTAVANRYYKITYFEPMIQWQTAVGYATARLRLTNVSGTILQYADIEVIANPNNDGQMLNFVRVTTLTAGATTIAATLQTNASTGLPFGNANARRFIVVEDIGPA